MKCSQNLNLEPGRALHKQETKDQVKVKILSHCLTTGCSKLQRFNWRSNTTKKTVF